MKITAIIGTEVKGCTWHLKEEFLSVLREGNEISEFTLPKDMPHFCRGCKVCFMNDEAKCPQAQAVQPIWNALLQADLIVFAAPVYALRTPGQVKVLLDHLCVHWMVHRPNPAMFTKRAVILTQSIGAPNGSAQKDIAASLTWMGVSDIRRLGFGLMEGVIWEELSKERREKMVCAVQRLAARYHDTKKVRMSIKVRMMFAMCKAMHKEILKKGGNPDADNRYWIKQGWLSVKGKR